MDRCLATDDCNAFTFDTLHRYTKNCWLKSKSESINNTNYEMRPDMIAGMRCSFQPLEEPPNSPDGKYPLKGKF